MDLSVSKKGSVLIMGPSGAGKTSLLRAVAGLWEQGDGDVRWAANAASEAAAALATAAAKVKDADGAAAASAEDEIQEKGSTATAAALENNGLYFIPQRPYLVLGTLRQQLLYPTWVQPEKMEKGAVGANEDDDIDWSCGIEGCAPKPEDAELAAALERVNLGRVHSVHPHHIF